MKNRVLCVVLLLLFVSTAAGQNVEIFGYFESQLMGAQINNEFIHCLQTPG